MRRGRGDESQRRGVDGGPAQGGGVVVVGGMSRVAVRAPDGEALRVARVRVRRGALVRQGQPLLEWRPPEGGSARPPPPLRAPLAGAVATVLVREDDVLAPGQSVLEIEACAHTTVMKDLCADCGADLRSDDNSQVNIAVVPMVHSVPELKVSEELAQKIGKEDSERLLRDRKLVLLVDLDQTLIHTTNDNIPPNIKDVRHFPLRSWGPGGYGGSRWYHTRLRPGTLDFLKSISKLYELHICTFGARAYAHQVAELLDPNGELFSHRILSRDECFDIHTKTPNLRALFPCGDNLVCIIDDREDVWNRAANLIQVKPYHFFEHTGDINAPPGLEKMERDVEGQGVHLEDMQFKKEDTANETDEVSKSNTEMPLLDAEDSEMTTPDSTQIEKENKKKNSETNVQETIVKESDESELILNPNVPLKEEPEPAIVKDIEKIVSQVQENFITSDSLKNVADNKSKTEESNNSLDKLNNSECDSTTSVLEQNNGTVQNMPPKWKVTEDGQIDIEDSDDYLLYLEEILQRIHKLFYELYDTMEAGSVPDLKTVIPQVKGHVLSGTSLVFSGLVPTHQKLENSRAYMVAQSLGAEVTQDFTEKTTHLVAVRPGTAKVHACRRIISAEGRKNLHIVTPSWLWCCAERWQHVDEKIFPLRGNTRLPRRPPPHCGSPPRIPQNNTTPRRRTPSGRFMDTINPLLSFSSADIADMDKEVEDIINESDESDSEMKTSENGNAGEKVEIEDTSKNILEINSSDSNDSSESLSGEYPHGWKPEKVRKRRRSGSSFSTDNEADSTPPKQVCEENNTLKLTNDVDVPSDDDESPNEKFRRGEDLPSDAPDQNESDTDGSNEPPDDVDDGEWNMMGAALEREFLGLDK